MKLVILDGESLNPGDLSWEPLYALADVTLYAHSTQEQVIERIGDADGVLINKIEMTKEIIDACPNLKYIGVQATGYNVVDIKAAQEKGITVTNVPAYSTEAVAQHTFALLLEITNRISVHHADIKNGKWETTRDFYFLNGSLIELSGKTIGLIGFGAIAKQVAKLALAFNMNVITYTRTKNQEFEAMGVTFVDKEELFQKADIVSVHIPLNEQTKYFINKDVLSLMKPTAILINTARGAIINEADLRDALNSNTIYAAGVDVASIEPLSSDSPLKEAKNLIMTPHIAWAPYETRNRCISIVVDNVNSFVNQAPINVVS